MARRPPHALSHTATAVTIAAASAPPGSPLTALAVSSAAARANTRQIALAAAAGRSHLGAAALVAAIGRAAVSGMAQRFVAASAPWNQWVSSSQRPGANGGWVPPVPPPLPPAAAGTREPLADHGGALIVPEAGEDGVPVVRERLATYEVPFAPRPGDPASETAYVWVYGDPDGEHLLYVAWPAEHWETGPVALYRADYLLLERYANSIARGVSPARLEPLGEVTRAAVVEAFHALAPEARAEAWRSGHSVRERRTAEGLLRLTVDESDYDAEVYYTLTQEMADGTAVEVPIEEWSQAEAFLLPAERAEIDAAMPGPARP